jgi:hypothetical protein
MVVNTYWFWSTWCRKPTATRGAISGAQTDTDCCGDWVANMWICTVWSSPSRAGSPRLETLDRISFRLESCTDTNSVHGKGRKEPHGELNWPLIYFIGHVRNKQGNKYWMVKVSMFPVQARAWWTWELGIHPTPLESIRRLLDRSGRHP